MSNIEQISQELLSLGYEPSYTETPQGKTVVISYKISVGVHNGEIVRLGFSFQEDGYPEYPPHWIHISPPYNDDLGGSIASYQCVDQKKEKEWLALSRPPQDIWDTLPTKHMSAYLSQHITRFCRNLK